MLLMSDRLPWKFSPHKRMKLFAVAIALTVAGCQAAPPIQPVASKASAQPASPSATSSAPALSMSQYEAIKTGMSLKEVEAIVGSPGKETFSSEIGGIKTAAYIWQGGASNLTVTFQGDRVTSKAQFNLQ
jgi:hypothetical protein